MDSKEIKRQMKTACNLIHTIENIKVNECTQTKTPDAKEDMEILQTLRLKFTGGDGWLVMISGADYYVVETYNVPKRRYNQPVVHTYQTYTLPMDMKGKVGMLKLVDVNTAINTIGLRISDNSFYILKEKDMSEEGQKPGRGKGKTQALEHVNLRLPKEVLDFYKKYPQYTQKMREVLTKFIYIEEDIT